MMVFKDKKAGNAFATTEQQNEPPDQQKLGINVKDVKFFKTRNKSEQKIYISWEWKNNFLNFGKANWLNRVSSARLGLTEINLWA